MATRKGASTARTSTAARRVVVRSGRSQQWPTVRLVTIALFIVLVALLLSPAQWWQPSVSGSQDSLGGQSLGPVERRGFADTFSANTGKPATAFALSPTGDKIVIATNDGVVSLWDAASIGRVKALYTLPSGTLATVMAWSPDGKLVAVGLSSNKIAIINSANGLELKQLSGHTAQVSSLSWSPDSKYLASAAGLVYTLSTDEVYFGELDPVIRIWDVAAGKSLKNFGSRQTTGNVYAVSWSKDGSKLATAHGDPTTTRVDDSEFNVVRVWDPMTAGLIKTFNNHKDDVISVDWSPDGKRILSGSIDNRALAFDYATGRLLTEVKTNKPVLSVAFMPAATSGKYRTLPYSFAASNGASRAYFWDRFALASPSIGPVTIGHEGGSTQLQWANDGSLFSLAPDATERGNLRIWRYPY